MGEVEETTATYDLVASRYAERWRHTDPMGPSRERFTARLPASALVLDAGCGPGRDLELLRAAGLRAVGVDASIGMLRQARSSGLACLVLGDLRRLPFATASCDGAWACASLLHLPRAQLPPALGELRRVLKPGGWLYLSVRQGTGERWASDDGMGRRFFTYWSQGGIDAALSAAGLVTEERWTDLDEAGRPSAWICRLARRPG